MSDAAKGGDDPSPSRLLPALRDLLLLAAAFVAAATAVGIYATYRIVEVGRHDERRYADAIVVLGAAQFNGSPSRVLAARLDHAIELYRDGLAPYLVVTGGRQPGDVTTEAATSRAYAVRHGVPASAILEESTGRTTLESLTNVRAVLAARGLASALFVSDRTHMLRVLRMASDLGIEGWGSPTSTSPTDTEPGLRFSSTVHELGALVLYALVEQPVPEPPLVSAVAPGAASSGAAVASSVTPGAVEAAPEPPRAVGSPWPPAASSGARPSTLARLRLDLQRSVRARRAPDLPPAED